MDAHHTALFGLRLPVLGYHVCAGRGRDRPRLAILRPVRKPAVGRRLSDGRADAFSLGVGFLGGRLDFGAQEQRYVVGPTKAASIWATAAIGIATGSATNCS